MPAIEYVAPPETSPEMAKLANDGMAEIVAQHPKRFPAFAASVPMNNVKAALAEIRRAIETLDARGIQIMTNVNGRPLDDPELAPIFELMHSHDLPIWMHPTRPQKFADYPTETGSKYDIWWCFRLALRDERRDGAHGVLRLLRPLAEFEDHHAYLGAMVPIWRRAWVSASTIRIARRRRAALRRDHRQHEKAGTASGRLLQEFFGDTAINGSRAGTRCGIEFFGCEHVLFGTDCPFDPQGGPLFIRDIIKVLDELEISADDRRKIYELNAKQLLRLK